MKHHSCIPNYIHPTNEVDVNIGGLLGQFDYCTFRNGSDEIATGLLVIENDQELKIFKANFPNAKRAATYNVVKETDEGSVMMYTATGTFAGEDDDFDPYLRINWSDPALTVTPGHQDVLDTANVTSFTVANTGTGIMDWTASVPSVYSSWLSITGGSSGTDAGIIDLAFETNTGVARTGKVIITAPYALNSPDTVEVRQRKAEYYIIMPSDILVSGDDTCVDAHRTITVPDFCGSYLIESGANLTLIAGDSIKLMPGFHAAEDSYFHAFISDLPCVLKNPPLVLDKNRITEEKYQLFNVFPNPATENITIEFAGDLPESTLYLEIYSSLGKPVYKEVVFKKNILEVNLSGFGSGIYFIKAICGEEVFMKKIVKY